MRDDDVRSSCFASLDVLVAQYGGDVPYRAGLDQGFPFRGNRVPFLNHQKGIYRAAAQRGPAALSIVTSFKSPYDDAEVPEGILYAYRSGPIDQPDNRALRATHELHVPFVYFVATRPGWYKPLYPCFALIDDVGARRVLIAPGRMTGPFDERHAVLIEDAGERRYAVREVRVRMHQARFRGQILLAYDTRCAICKLKEARLLDAAHIVGDLEETGDPLIPNGLSLCSIHHRAYDQDLVGVSPDYEVRVSPRLLEEDDGPMLELLKEFHTAPISLPVRRAWRPDRERLALRFERFETRS